jgi:hypothetical protein
MSRVNPPPFAKIPKEFAANRETKSYFENIQFTLFQLWKRTGGGTDEVEQSLQYVASSSARLADLEQRIGSGDFLTSDETGFTVD